MKKAKDLIQKVEKDIEKQTTEKIKKEFKEKTLASKQHELHRIAAEVLSKKFEYVAKDLKDFKNEIQKICKGVYVHIKNNQNTFLDHEGAYSGDLNIGKVSFWAKEDYAVQKEIQYIWRLALDVEGLYIEEHGDKLDKKNIQDLVKAKNFIIYQEVKDGFSWEGGQNSFEEYKIPMDRYDLFFEKYVAQITRKVKEKLGSIQIRKDPEIKKKKKFFFF